MYVCMRARMYVCMNVCIRRVDGVGLGFTSGSLRTDLRPQRGFAAASRLSN